MVTARLADTATQPTRSGETTMTDPYPDQPAPAPLFSAERHSDTTAAHPNPVAANQVPVFLAAERPAAPA